MKRGSRSSTNTVVDGLSDEDEISEVFRVKLMGTLNKYADFSFDPSDLDLESSDLHYCSFSAEVIFEAIGHLKKGKRDSSNLDSTHFVVQLLSFQTS